MSGKPRQQTLKAAGLVIHSQAAESNGCMSCLPFTQSRTPSQGMGHLLLSCLPTSVSPAVTTSHRHGQRFVSQVTPDFAKLTLTVMCSQSRDSLYWRLRSWEWAWPSRSCLTVECLCLEYGKGMHKATCTLGPTASLFTLFSILRPRQLPSNVTSEKIT